MGYGFLTLAIILSCFLFWGAIILLLTHSVLLANILEFVLAMMAALLCMCALLFVIRFIFIRIIGEDRRDFPSSLDTPNNDLNTNSDQNKE